VTASACWRNRLTRAAKVSRGCRRAAAIGSSTEQEITMNWDQFEGNWKQLKGRIREQWGELTDDDLDVINGRRQQLTGKLQERYGIAKAEAERQIDEFCRVCTV
jgi:uncharacterized protein YjbJ (UPF0337 family)